MRGYARSRHARVMRSYARDHVMRRYARTTVLNLAEN